MSRRLFLPLIAPCLAAVLAGAPQITHAQTQPPARRASATPGLVGEIAGDHYIAPGELYRIKIPVLPQLGGTVSDTGNVVVFRDDYSVHVSIGAFVLDATQRWELSTMEREDYLSAFFATLVMPDFERMFPGSQIEQTRYDADQLGGTVFCVTLLPGGSMFPTPFAEVRAEGDALPIAKRGNLIFAQHGVIYVLSTELTERLQSGKNYKKTPEEENALIAARLDALLATMQFAEPKR